MRAKYTATERTRLKGYMNEDGHLVNQLTVLKLSMDILSCCSSIAKKLAPLVNESLHHRQRRQKISINANLGF